VSDPRTAVSSCAVRLRVNRALPASQRVRRTRSGPRRTELGVYFIAERRSGRAVICGVDLEHLARALGVLQRHERIA
jgi:hypothetical protein